MTLYIHMLLAIGGLKTLEVTLRYVAGCRQAFFLTSCFRSYIWKSAANSMRSAIASSRLAVFPGPCRVGSLIHSNIFAKSPSQARGCTSHRTSTMDISPSRCCRRWEMRYLEGVRYSNVTLPSLLAMVGLARY